VDLIYVEATPAQVESVLTALKADVKNFSAVQVEPDPNDPKQRRFIAFSRGAPLENLAQQMQSKRAAAPGRDLSGGMGGGFGSEQREIGPMKTAPQDQTALPNASGTIPSSNFYQRQTAENLSNFAQRIPLTQQSANLEQKQRAAGSSGERSEMQTSPAFRAAAQNLANVRQNRQRQSTALGGVALSNQQVLFVLRRTGETSAAASSSVREATPLNEPKEPAPAKGR
jgi:hypothetical protein